MLNGVIFVKYLFLSCVIGLNYLKIKIFEYK